MSDGRVFVLCDILDEYVWQMNRMSFNALLTADGCGVRALQITWAWLPAHSNCCSRCASSVLSSPPLMDSSYRPDVAWDVNLCMELPEKVVVPFHHLVKLQPPISQTSSLQFFRFLDLPLDIQLVVYEHCDLSTLFQLMQTCSHTRGPATQFFWENPSESSWYYSRYYNTSAYPITLHCPEFARKITKIELNVHEIGGVFSNAEDTTNSTAVMAQEFWNRVCQAFPALRRVVLAAAYFYKHLPSSVDDLDGDYTIVETVVDYAPLYITVQIAVEEPESYPEGIRLDHPQRLKPLRYTLWEVIVGQEPAWQMVDQDWTPTRILLPPRKFPESILGDLVTFTSRSNALNDEKRGLDWLMIETYVRYAVDGVIHCPRPDCAATFVERASWEKHMSETVHWRLDCRPRCQNDPEPLLRCFEGTPATERAAIEARRQHIRDNYDKTLELQRRIGRVWDERVSRYKSDSGDERHLAHSKAFYDLFFAQIEEEAAAASGGVMVYPDDAYCHWYVALVYHFDPLTLNYMGE
jgi:hypothetical protein